MLYIIYIQNVLFLLVTEMNAPPSPSLTGGGGGLKFARGKWVLYLIPPPPRGGAERVKYLPPLED